VTTEAIAGTSIRPMAVTYLRVSTKEQAGRGGEREGFSIPAQREACLRKAEAMGAQVVAEFVDAGESARSANRPELKKMLAFVADHRVGFVIVHKVDRLARNRVDDVEINLALSAAGAQLVSCSENIDETPSGMLLHGIMSSIAEFYSRNLATEAKKGMRQKAKSGGTPGRAPFGYLNTRERSEDGREVRTVELDPDRSRWVPWLFERYATGLWTTAMLRDELEHQGVKSLASPKRPAAPLANSHVAKILQNRYYVGVVTFEGVEYPGRHEALITEELFDTVQRVRESRVLSKEKPRVHPHYLKGSIFCGECGDPLSYAISRNRLGTEYRYFYCLGRQAYKNGCQFRATQVHVIEQLIEKHWETVTLSERRVREIRQLVWEHVEVVLPAQVSERQEAEQRLDQLNRESNKLLQAHYADAISLDQLKHEQSRIAVARAAIERTLARATAGEELIRAKLDKACTLLQSAAEHYRAADSTIRRDLNQGVFDRIYVDDDAVVGSDLTPAFRQLMSDTLSADLVTERKREQKRHVRTSDLYLVPGVSESADRGGRDESRNQPMRYQRTAPSDRFGAYLRRERPQGSLPWESKNPEPLQVRGSNELLLVGLTGFEPAASSSRTKRATKLRHSPPTPGDRDGTRPAAKAEWSIPGAVAPSEIASGFRPARA